MWYRQRRTFVGIGIVFLLTSLLYWFYFSPPAHFPSHSHLVKEMNNVYPEASANIIQDTIQADERHVVVPFISKTKQHGLSYWVWKNHKWRVLRIETKGGPKIWKIRQGDPSSFFFVWNIHPEDRLDSIQFYLIRDRGFQVTDGNELYYSRVQLEKSIQFESTNYGVMQMPAEWAEVMNADLKVGTVHAPHLPFSDFSASHSFQFGWIAKDDGGQEVFPENSVNGSSYHLGNINTDYVSILNTEELELSE